MFRLGTITGPKDQRQFEPIIWLVELSFGTLIDATNDAKYRYRTVFTSTTMNLALFAIVGNYSDLLMHRARAHLGH